MLTINRRIQIPENEIEIAAIRAQGSGGQNVNKVSNAVHLRFDIRSSSLPDDVKQRLLEVSDQRITSEGVIVIKGQQFRSLEQNRDDALERLVEIIRKAIHVPKSRKATKPTRASQQRRVDTKKTHGRTKSLRKKISYND